jgi:hypothetical protein
MHFVPRFSHRMIAAGALAVVSVTAAGAATLHRFDVSQSAGSGGATDFVQSSTTGSALQGAVGSADTTYGVPFGVFGVYDVASPAPFGIGVLGASTTGYGVAAETFSDIQPSLLAYPGGNGIGLEATNQSTSANPAVYSESKGTGDAGDFYADQSGAGLYGEATASTGAAGVIGETSGSDGLIGTNDTSGSDVFLADTSGGAVFAYGTSGNATAPVLSAIDSAGGSDLIAAYTHNSGNGVESFIVQSGTGKRSATAQTGGSDVQVSGDLYVSGQVYQACAAFPAVPASTSCAAVPAGSQSTSVARSSGADAAVHSANGRDVQMFGTRETLPSVEDYGQAQLVGGRAYVRLDPAFAATMSRSSPYLVFITPGGDSRGLFVANRTLQGFEVHENAGGRTTLAFDYRIVAKPFADTSQRLAEIAPVVARPHIATAADLAERARLQRFTALRARFEQRHAAVHRPIHFMPTAASLLRR